MPPTSPKSPSSNAASLHGVFRNGSWYCNCEPRRLARKKLVTKNTKNYGRGFYVCNIDPKEGNACGFFLWCEDAEKRERASFSTNGRSEKRQTTLHESITPRKSRSKKDKQREKEKVKEKEVIDAGDCVDDAVEDAKGGAAPTLINQPAAATLKSKSASFNHYENTTSCDEEDDDNSPINTRKRKRLMDDDEPDFLDELSSGGEEELLAVTDQSATKAYNNTNNNSSSVFTTPNTQRTDVKNGMPTPSLTQSRTTKKVLFQDIMAPSNTKRPRLENEGSSSDATAVELWGTSAVINAPPPATATNASKPPAAVPQPESLTKEVMELLKNENIPHSVRGAVRKTLDKYVSQAKGYERGRDAARKLAKEAEDRAVRLQKRVDALEKSRQDLRTQLMEMWSSM